MDFLVLSHLRWKFVFQRPQHLMSRCAQGNRVFFCEEPIYDASGSAYLEVNSPSQNLYVVLPHLPRELEDSESSKIQELLLRDLLRQHAIRDYALWYYTP